MRSMFQSETQHCVYFQFSFTVNVALQGLFVWITYKCQPSSQILKVFLLFCLAWCNKLLWRDLHCNAAGNSVFIKIPNEELFMSVILNFLQHTGGLTKAEISGSSSPGLNFPFCLFDNLAWEGDPENPRTPCSSGLMASFPVWINSFCRSIRDFCGWKDKKAVNSWHECGIILSAYHWIAICSVIWRLWSDCAERWAIVYGSSTLFI